MKFFFIDDIRLWKNWIIFVIRILRISISQFLIVFDVEFLEIFKRQLKCITQFDSNFLLLLENELVILHVFFGVSF